MLLWIFNIKEAGRLGWGVEVVLGWQLARVSWMKRADCFGGWPLPLLWKQEDQEALKLHFLRVTGEYDAGSGLK